LLAIAVIGLAMVFLGAAWKRFKVTNGEQISPLGRYIIVSTAVIMLVVFLFSLAVRNPPEAGTEADISSWSFIIFTICGWGVLGLIGVSKASYYNLWRKLMEVGIKKTSSLSISELDEKVKEWGQKAPNLMAWCGCCGTLIVAIACGILALILLGMGAVGQRYSTLTLEWGPWLSWSAVIIFAIGVSSFTLGYIMEMLDIWPLNREKKK
jgi:hypothetical protein